MDKSDVLWVMIVLRTYDVPRQNMREFILCPMFNTD